MARVAIWPKELGLFDFSGGLNLRDAPTELAINESPDLWNVTMDERGGVQKRLGYRKVNSTVFGGGLVKNVFEWQSGGHVITQAGDKLYRDNDTTARHTFTTADRAGFADFDGSLWVIHPVDGLYSSTDGVTYTLQAAGPKGTFLLPSKNRLVAGGDPANKARLYASAISDGTDWSTTAGHGWTNDIVEVNNAALVAAAAVGGEDTQGRPGFVLFKGESFYRVYDSDTGAYTTLDATVGAASAISAVGVRGRVVWVSPAGVFWTDGVSESAREASKKIAPLFKERMVAFDQADLFCAGAIGDRVNFSLPRAGSTANDLALEYHPDQGWFAAGSHAMSCYASISEDADKLYGGSPTVSGQVYELGAGGTDDAAAIVCRYQTKWLAPAGGIECEFHKVRVFGRGLFDLYTRVDFDTGDGDLENVSLPGGALVWGQGNWAEELWAPANFEDWTDLNSLGHGTHISFVAKETGSVTATAPKLLGTGNAPEVGVFALYGLNLQFVPIGA